MGRKIGWKMKLRRKLRQDRKEEKIRAKDLAKREKQQSEILGDTDIDAIKESSAKIREASNKLSEDGIVTEKDPIEVMTAYNEQYGDGQGSPDLDIYAEQSFGQEYSENFDGESLMDENAYAELLHNVGNIISTFENTFDSTYNGNFEELENIQNENFDNKENFKFKDIFKKASGVVKTFKRGKVEEEKEKELKRMGGNLAPTITMLILGALVGIAIQKIFFK